jgi:hypothetical protein
MSEGDQVHKSGRLGSTLRRDWGEIGGLGRLGVIGLALALVVTVVLGFSITRTARGHLLDARASMVEAAVGRLPFFGVDDPPSAAEFAALDAAVRVQILGGETVIGAGAVIGGGTWITESVPADGRVSLGRSDTIPEPDF